MRWSIHTLFTNNNTMITRRYQHFLTLAEKGRLDSVEWNGGLEWWNGMVEWTGMVDWYLDNFSYQSPL